jgi:hypothetical protein
MPFDDRAALAALLATAREVLERRLRSGLDGAADDDAAMIARALALAARALAAPDRAWSALDPPTGGNTRARAAALRRPTAERLAVTNPGYAAEVEGAPP